MAFSTNLMNAGRLAENIGVPEMMMLSAWFAGRNIYVPVSTDDSNHLLQKITGQEGFARLVKNYGGQLLSVPDCDVEPLRRAGIVHRLTLKGVSAEDIGQLCGISPRTVHNLRQTLRLEGFPQIADLLPGDASEVGE